MGVCANEKVEKAKVKEKEWKIIKTEQGNIITKDYVEVDRKQEQRRFRKKISSYFDLFDSNHDGLLNMSELQQFLKAIYGKRGINKDFKQIAKSMMEKIDYNGDQFISKPQIYKFYFESVDL